MSMAVDTPITEIEQDITEVNKDLLVAQYSALRSEIHQRMDQRQQLLTYVLLGAASFFSIGVQPQVASATVLCYPVLAFFLACAWGQHDTRIGEITVFLRAMEDRGLFGALGLGWETYRRTTFKKRRFSLFDSVSLSARGLFAGSDLLAVVLGVARFFESRQMVGLFVFLLVADLVVIAATLMALTHRRSRDPQSPNVTARRELTNVTIDATVDVKEEANV